MENTFSSLRRITPGQHPNLSEAIDRLRILMLKKNVKVIFLTIGKPI